MASLYPLTAILMMAVVGLSKANIYTTNGRSGEDCGSVRCIANESKCVNNTCQCNEKFHFGRGTLKCYKKNEFRAEVTNDPSIRTYNNNSVDMPIPCRYLLTHAVTELKGRNRKVVGSCEFMVFTFHKKIKGKFFVGGYDVAIRVELNNGSRYEVSIRKYGTAEKGFYKFTVLGTDSFFYPNGPYGNDVINFFDPVTRLRIRCQFDTYNNFALLTVKKCGFSIRFRPYDVKWRRRQPMIPGMTVAINCAFRPEYESLDMVMALPPFAVHNGFDMKSIRIAGLTNKQTMIYRAYRSGVVQNQPEDGNEACAEAKDIFGKCDFFGEVQTAFKECLWILESPRFIKCFDKTKNGIEIQDLFNKCVNIYCDNGSCSEVIKMIKDKKCDKVKRYSKLENFVKANSCRTT